MNTCRKHSNGRMTPFRSFLAATALLLSPLGAGDAEAATRCVRDPGDQDSQDGLAASLALEEAQQRLAAAVDGSVHDAVSVAQAALTQAGVELDDCLTATVQAVEHAQAYASTL